MTKDTRTREEKLTYDRSREGWDNVPQQSWYIDPKDIVEKAKHAIAVGYYIYFLICKDEIVYVGKTNNPYYRVGTHLLDKAFDKVHVIEFNNKRMMNFAEMYYIDLLKPKYNKLLPLAGNIYRRKK